MGAISVLLGCFISLIVVTMLFLWGY